MSQHFSTIGQIATDPKLFTPAGGTAFCTFRLASAERRYDATKQEWTDSDTNWFTVNTFRGLAQHAKSSFSKGDRVVVTGKLRVRAWEADEKRGTSVEIDADGIGHDVRFGVSVFVKSPVPEARGAGVMEAAADAGATEAAADAGLTESGLADSGLTDTGDGFTPTLASA
ncbi:MAG: single-stranded DNA-binding protein [Leucobacter sp.]|nr:single-stranded DNA-binding protein [Leucobacter sp.]